MSKQNPETFQIGDTVTWTSQAGGKSKTKKGIVLYVIPPAIVPKNHVTAGGWNWKRVGVTFRDHESYLIQVGKSKRLYWPLVKYLEKVPETITLPNEMPKEGQTLIISKVTEKGYEMEWDDDPMWPGEGCGYDAVDVGDGSNPDL